MIKIEIHPAKGKAKGQFYMVIVNGKQRLVNETVQSYRSCLNSALGWAHRIMNDVDFDDPDIYDYAKERVNCLGEGFIKSWRPMTKKEINRYKNA